MKNEEDIKDQLRLLSNKLDNSNYTYLMQMDKCKKYSEYITQNRIVGPIADHRHYIDIGEVLPVYITTLDKFYLLKTPANVNIVKLYQHADKIRSKYYNRRKNIVNDIADLLVKLYPNTSRNSWMLGNEALVIGWKVRLKKDKGWDI